MPIDNIVPVAGGASIAFAQNGPTSGTILRNSTTQFILSNIGIYEINFQVSVAEPGQLVVVLGGVEQLYTIVGRAAVTSQIVGMCLVQTTLLNTVLSINNPAVSVTALTMTPIAGGTHSVSAHLVIKQVF